MCKLRWSLVWAAAADLSSGTLTEASQPAQRPPNIVFILADDLGGHDRGCYGRKDHPTPHLDKLAKQGVRFTTAYAAQSLCSPTRAAILTGKAPARLHLTTLLPGRADAPSQLLNAAKINQQQPAYLRMAGYISALIGKWYLGGKSSLPTDHGFDVYHPGQY